MREWIGGLYDVKRLWKKKKKKREEEEEEE